MNSKLISYVLGGFAFIIAVLVIVNLPEKPTYKQSSPTKIYFLENGECATLIIGKDTVKIYSADKK